MWLRRAVFRWLLPAAFLLPLWLIVGWAVFQGGWAILWVLFIAVPSVLVGQLALTLLTRSRPSVRAERAVSWLDVAGFATWHALTVAVGCFVDGAFGWLLIAAILVGLGLVWLQVWQLWTELRGSGVGIRETVAWSQVRPSGQRAATSPQPEVIIVEETDSRG